MFIRRVWLKLPQKSEIADANFLSTGKIPEGLEGRKSASSGNWNCAGWQLGVVLTLGMGSAIAFWGNEAIAQIVPDNTLENENSLVSPTSGTFQIDGGTARDTNLFHSFSEFSVPTGTTAFFNNNLNIQNIISRVTGSSLSNIDGTLKANGAANLFLINPKGIVFGQNARLELGGSFVATTANALQFGDQGIFSASAPNTPPTLTVNPSAFLFNQLANQRANPITVQEGAVLSVGFSGASVRTRTPGSLLLVGGDVTIKGATLQGAAGSQIQVGGFTGTGSVGLSSTDNQLGLILPANGVVGANVSLDGALFNLGTSRNDAGNIFVTGGNLSLTNGTQLSSSTFGRGKAGIVYLQGDNVSIDSSALFSTAAPRSSGNSGGILIDARAISLSNSRLDTTNKGSGIAGDMIIRGRDRVSIVDSNIDSTSQSSADSGFGFIDISSAQGSVFLNNSKVITTNSSSGFAGDISISSSNTVSIENQSQVSSQGNLGRIFIGRSDYSSLSPRMVTINNATLNADATNVDSAIPGSITISANDLIEVLNNSQLTSKSENDNTSDFSFIKLEATQGTVSLGNNSTLSTTNFGSGYAGDISISASNQVSIENQSSIFSQGNFGRIFVGRSDDIPDAKYSSFSPRRVTINNGSLNTNNSSYQGPGEINAGAILVRATDLVSLTNGAQLTSSTSREGEAGKIFVGTNARGSVSISGIDGTTINTAIFTTVESGGIGRGGNIEIDTGRLSLSKGAQLQTLVRGTDDGNLPGQGDAGTVTVNANDFVSVAGANDVGLPSAIFSTVQPGAIGTAGGITIDATTLFIRDGAAVSVNNLELGAAGDITINVRDLRLENQGKVTAVSTSGQGGNINLLARDLLVLTRNSDISTTAGIAPGGGDGGNITANTINGYIFGIPVGDNNFTAQAYLGNGGSITIDAAKLYKIGPSPDDFLNTNDITVSSRYGREGISRINDLNVDPTQGFTNLPVDAVDTSRLIAQRCALRSRTSGRENKFVVTGPGGLPPSPNDTLQNESVVTNWVSLDPPQEHPSGNLTSEKLENSTSAVAVPKTPTYVEAQGWVIDEKGEVILTAQAPTVTPHNPTLTPANVCNGS